MASQFCYKILGIADPPINPFISVVDGNSARLQWAYGNKELVSHWCVYPEIDKMVCTNNNSTNSIDIDVESNTSYTLHLLTIPLATSPTLPSHPESLNFSTLGKPAQ